MILEEILFHEVSEDLNGVRGVCSLPLRDLDEELEVADEVPADKSTHWEEFVDEYGDLFGIGGAHRHHLQHLVDAFVEVDVLCEDHRVGRKDSIAVATPQSELFKQETHSVRK